MLAAVTLLNAVCQYSCGPADPPYWELLKTFHRIERFLCQAGTGPGRS